MDESTLDRLFYFCSNPSFLKEAPVIVCLDFEPWERNKGQILEIGIAILDTATLPPLTTDNLSEWMSAVKAENVVIKEHLHLANHYPRFGDGFIFGEPTTRSLADIRKILLDALHADRAVVLAGHGLTADMKHVNRYLQGSQHRGQNAILQIDTQHLWKSGRIPKLTLLLDAFEIDHDNLRVAGNDAMWTMQLLLTMMHSHRFDQGRFRTAVQHVIDELLVGG